MFKSKNVFICFGATHYDYLINLQNKLIKFRTNPINHSQRIGGVAYNVAEILSIFTKIDLFTLKIPKILKDNINKKKISLKELNKKNNNQYYLSLSDNKNNFLLGLANTNNYEKINKETKLPKLLKKNIIFDLNFSKEFINKAIKLYKKNNIIIICGTSIYKIYKIKKIINYIDYIFLNKSELYSLTKENNIKKSIKKLSKKNKNIKIVITDGSNYTYFFINNTIYKAKPPKMKIKDENGAGDVLSGIIIYYLSKNVAIEDSLKYGISAGSLYASGVKIKNKSDIKKINYLSKKIKINKIKFK